MPGGAHTGLPDYGTWATAPRRPGVVNIFRPDPARGGVDITIEPRMAGGMVQFCHCPPGAPETGYFRIPLASAVPIEVGAFVIVRREWGTSPCSILLTRPGGDVREMPLAELDVIVMLKTGDDWWHAFQFTDK